MYTPKAVMGDGSPFFPEKDSLFKIAEEEKLDIFGVSAKYIDALRKYKPNLKFKFKLQKLKTVQILLVIHKQYHLHPCP